MMNIKIQVIIAVIVVTALCVIINMIRAKNLELRYALAWLIVGVGILVLDCFPGLMFFFGFCFSLVIIFVLTVAVSRMSIRIKQLAQELALHEKENADKK